MSYDNLQPVEKTIGADVFSVTPYMAKQNITFMKRLTKVLGKSIGVLFSGGSVSEEDGEDGIEKAVDNKIEKAVSLLVDNLDNDNIVELIEDMVKKAGTRKNGKEVNFDLDFGGKNVYQLFQVLMLIYNANWATFTEGGIGV